MNDLRGDRGTEGRGEVGGKHLLDTFATCNPFKMTVKSSARKEIFIYAPYCVASNFNLLLFLGVIFRKQANSDQNSKPVANVFK